MTEKKVCVILGAGASYDVWGPGTHVINAEYKPPLTSTVFNMSNNVYSNIIGSYPGAEYLANMLAEYAISGEKGIEDYLRHYVEHPTNEIMRRFFKQVPGYLRDLFHQVSDSYVSQPSSYIRLFNDLHVEHEHSILFIVLNYDNLLEQALQKYPGFYFDDITHYIEASRPVKVIKLHGSINWVKSLGKWSGDRAPKDTWINFVDDYDIFQPIEESEIQILSIAGNICNYTGTERMLYYPIMTAPLAGKDIRKTVCPLSHMEAATEFLSDCHKFLIIGTSGLDEDLKEFLYTSINHRQNPDPEVVIVNNDTQPHVTDNVVRQFGESVFKDLYALRSLQSYKGGFRNYLASQEFQKFAKSP